MQGLNAHRRWWLLLRGVLGVGLIALLVTLVDWDTLVGSFLQASPTIIALGILVYYTGVALSCYKWQILLKIEGLSPPFGKLYRWYLISAFASNFLPTDIGGDLGRAYFAGRYTDQPIAVARSIIVERATGFALMLILAWLGMVVLLPWQPFVIGLSIAGFSAIVGIWTIWHYRFWRPTIVLSTKALMSRLPLKLRQVAISSTETARRVRGQPKIVALILLISLIFQLQAGFGLWLNLYAVGICLPVGHVILAQALTSIIGLLPISVNGWGVRETTLIALLGSLGANRAGILAGSLLARALILALSMVGAILLPIERNWHEVEVETDYSPPS